MCKPYYSIARKGSIRHHCLCPEAHFGPTCSLRVNQCDRKPCKNGGSCFITYQPDDIFSYKCICTNFFHGNNCEIEKPSVSMKTVTSASFGSIIATTVLYYDIDLLTKADLSLQERQTFASVPANIHFRTSKTVLPLLSIIKVYNHDYQKMGAAFCMGYLKKEAKTINISNDLKLTWPHVTSLWDMIGKNVSSELYLNIRWDRSVRRSVGTVMYAQWRIQCRNIFR